MNTSLISIPTDTVALEGAWYEPQGRERTGAALLFHGNTMNFYSGAPRFLPPALTDLALACLAFNRRGHDILAIRDSRAPKAPRSRLLPKPLPTIDMPRSGWRSAAMRIRW